ncbi:MAG: DNA polymerase III subunit alpha [Chlamydiae bacterium]|nr:DNA polymerase III subunit alpha [Chlamydiota bacterium]
MVWIPLHVHSQYSILDSTASVSALVNKASEYSLSHMAITDQGNMYAAVEFYKTCMSANIRPIIGCELFIAPHSRFDKKRIPGSYSGYPVILLAKDKQGYNNLCKLSSLAHMEGFYYTPRIDKDLLKKHSQGLICLSGPNTGLVPFYILSGKEKELLAEIQWFKDVFQDDYYFELQRHRMSEDSIAADKMLDEPWLYQKYLEFVKAQDCVNTKLISLSKDLGIPLVATNDIHYIHRDDWRAHEILLNIQSGEPFEIWERDSNGNPKSRTLNPKREVCFSHEFYFKTPMQMEKLFSDIPEAISNTFKIAQQCGFDFDFKAKYYPVFIPPKLENVEITSELREREAIQFLINLCEKGIEERYLPVHLEKVKEKYPDKDPIQVVKDRLSYELEIITSKGMCDYLLIVYDFIAWAKKNGIPVGPGRGSGAGSIILYLIGITDIEPLRFHLFFERFINPERISYPDIDVDICMERRQEVIEYTVKKYGKEKVAQIITFGTMKAKMAIKDVGRVLSVPLPKVNAIAKLVPEDPTITLEKALEVDPDLKAQYDADSETKNLIDLALKLEGSVRNTGIHAAGLIIGANPLMDHIPLCSSKDSEIAVTQYSMKPVEAVGMLKIDFLGLKTLTSIQRAVNAIRDRLGQTIDWVNLPLNDTSAFALLTQGKTSGIFQVESGGMQELLKQLHIDKFEEIIAVGALYRPGPMEMIPSFCNRKHGKEPIDIDHPRMEDILSETYGIMVYQEQVMQIASRLANYSLGEGDVLRRAMGKKDKEEMSRQREKFKSGAIAAGIGEELSMHIFDKIEKFASYGFNKSHAAAYGYLTYVTAYLKANYPGEWMAALMTSDSDDTTKVAKNIREAQTMGIAILPPDINESAKDFTAIRGGIRFAMSGIKGVGEGVVDSILIERSRGGLYKTLFDFIKRVDTKKVGKKVIEYLIEVGAFDFTGWSRQALIESVDGMFLVAAREQKEASKGIIDFFSMIDEGDEDRFTIPPNVKNEKTKQEILKREYELLGFYLQGHPLDDFRGMLQRLSCCPFSDFQKLDKNALCRAAFIIESVSIKISAKSQKKFAILVVSDGIERYELPIWPEMFEAKQALLLENQLLYAVLQIENEQGEIKLQCKWLDDLAKVDALMVSACDQAYDKARNQLKLNEMRERNSKPKAEGKTVEKLVEEKKLSSLLHLIIDADTVRLTHILKMKEIFRSSSGATPICMEFIAEAGRIGSVKIQENWGVNVTSQVEEKLRQIVSIKELKVITK